METSFRLYDLRNSIIQLLFLIVNALKSLVNNEDNDGDIDAKYWIFNQFSVENLLLEWRMKKESNRKKS